MTYKALETGDVATDLSAVTVLVDGPGLPADSLYVATFAIERGDVSGPRAVRPRMGLVLGACGVSVIDCDGAHVVSDLSPETLLAVECAAVEAAQEALDRAKERAA